MKTVSVTASRCYDVQIDAGLLNRAGEHIAAIANPCDAAIISDSNVWTLYGEQLKNSLTAAGFHVCHFVFPAGEESKNSATYLDILEFLAANQLTRSDLLIALGGGVVGDITGFAAATYLRGISFVQIPTTLLAMVDSSVGGKTAIDLAAGKNLAGAFYQPALVLCDLNTLQSLPMPVFRDGCAEVIKYGVLYDAQLFSHLETNGLAFEWEYVISRCVELKRNVVAQDEFDNGARQQLNLGHTLGHGIEAQSGYTVSHGNAVAAGIAIISRAACQQQLCSWQTAQRIQDVLVRFQLPIKTDYTAQQLFQSALSDKKRSGSTVNLILPKEIGSCFISPTPLSQLKSLIEAGL